MYHIVTSSYLCLMVFSTWRVFHADVFRRWRYNDVRSSRPVPRWRRRQWRWFTVQTRRSRSPRTPNTGRSVGVLSALDVSMCAISMAIAYSFS